MKERDVKQMENLVEACANKVLNDIIDRAIREAIILQLQSTEEFEKQKKIEESGGNYNYTRVHALKDGVRAVCHVLWKMFGGLPADCIHAIEKIVKDNEGDTYLGYDSRNYVKLFRDALEEE